MAGHDWIEQQKKGDGIPTSLARCREGRPPRKPPHHACTWQQPGPTWPWRPWQASVEWSLGAADVDVDADVVVVVDVVVNAEGAG